MQPQPRSTLFPYTTLFRSSNTTLGRRRRASCLRSSMFTTRGEATARAEPVIPPKIAVRSEEHTSELQSQSNLVCRLLLEKKKQKEKTDEGKRIVGQRGASL